MINVNDLIGKTINNITVLEFDHKGKCNKYYYYFYKCIDKNNNEYILSRNKILYGGNPQKEHEKVTNPLDIINKTINGYKIISLDHVKLSSNYDYYYKCKCGYCNRIFIMKRNDLIRCNQKSCGCMFKKFISQANGTHHMTNSRFYKIYTNMKTRCYNPKCISYPNYGGRGIRICDRWLESFENFRDDMYDSYLEHAAIYGEKNTTIDRINSNENYCPENCRWATYKFQGNNMRRNHIMEYNGEKLTLSQLVDKYADPKVSYANVIDRLSNNWSIGRALTEIPNSYRENKITIPIVFHDSKCPIRFND